MFDRVIRLSACCLWSTSDALSTVSQFLHEIVNCDRSCPGRCLVERNLRWKVFVSNRPRNQFGSLKNIQSCYCYWKYGEFAFTYHTLCADVQIRYLTHFYLNYWTFCQFLQRCGNFRTRKAVFRFGNGWCEFAIKICTWSFTPNLSFERLHPSFWVGLDSSDTLAGELLHVWRRKNEYLIIPKFDCVA